ncbi:uncharacterized protein LOC123259679 isoform X1 [Cotesia glomerata]|nr:uncharacterized protein LOC123259679 isoform X1 [Cotesia glomerata]
MITYNEKGLVKTSEEDIGKEIEALKKIVREQIDLDKRSNEIENSNLKSNEIKNIFTNKCPRSNDVDKKIKKRSASFERKNKSKKKPVVKKRKKSVSKNISIKSNVVDSNLITSKSKRHYKIWDTVEREGRSVQAVENKNSNGEDQSDDGLNVLNSQDNAQIASEYKEAFGGFPKDPADSLTRYKRIKRYKS